MRRITVFTFFSVVYFQIEPSVEDTNDVTDLNQS